MEPLTLMAILAGAGALTGAMDRNQQTKLNAAKEKYSHWTGQHGDFTKLPNAMDSGLKWGLAGASLGQAKQDYDLKKSFLEDKNNASLWKNIAANEPDYSGVKESVIPNISDKDIESEKIWKILSDDEKHRIEMMDKVPSNWRA